MQNWIISIIGGVILTTIVSFLLPEKSTAKTIKSVFSILLLLIIFKPLVNIDVKNLSFDNLFNGKDIALQEDYLDFYNEKLNVEKEEKCNKIVYNFGFKNGETKIEYKTLKDGSYKIEKVKIFLNSSVINKNQEHIDIIEELRDNVMKFLSIEKNLVIVYD